MLSTGLVSITFRQLTPAQIVDLVCEAALDGIEWGGDIHVPHGDLQRADVVRQLTQEAGLRVAAYGSYYRLGQSEIDGLQFERVLETAVYLDAPLIRVWADTRGSATADEAYRQLIAEESRHIAHLAGQAGIVVAYEFHGGTLTDTPESARTLLEEVAHPNVKTLWQPNGDDSIDQRRQGLLGVLQWLTNVHVFQWERRPDGSTGRLPLATGEAAWRRYFDAVATTERDHCALIEFVQDDEPEQFLQDAATLKRWLST